jgi:biopolymer transport protein ExbD
MAEIIQQESGHKKGGKRRAKKHSTHIDMTPMVDLMCLLITFFMLTTAFSKPKVMEIVLPEKKVDPNYKPPVVEEKKTINFLLTDSNRVYWYIGKADPNKPPLPELIKTDFSKDGIRKILLEKNEVLFAKIDSLKEKVLKGEIDIPKDSLDGEIKKLKSRDKTAPDVVLIKADEKTKYKNIVDIIDEMAICNIPRYTIVDMTKTELKMLETAPR